MKNALWVSMALALLVSMGCKTNRARGDREIIRAEESPVEKKEASGSGQGRTDNLLSDHRSRRDSIVAELAIVDHQMKKRQGEPPSAGRDQDIQDLSIKKKLLERDLRAIDGEIARLEKQKKDRPSGELSKEETESDAMLRMFEEEVDLEDELARARETERLRQKEERRRLEEERRMEEAARREALAAKTGEAEGPKGAASPFEERYAASILRIRTKLAAYKRW